MSLSCLSTPQVEFAAEGIKMELIEAARSGAAGAAAWGKMDFHCREPRASDPITFTTRDSHLVSMNFRYLQAGCALQRAPTRRDHLAEKRNVEHFPCSGVVSELEVPSLVVQLHRKCHSRFENFTPKRDFRYSLWQTQTYTRWFSWGHETCQATVADINHPLYENERFHAMAFRRTYSLK